MKIAIVKKSELNDCWSALQYTDNCVLCDKIITCKIKSVYHQNGLALKLQYEKDKILSEYENKLSKLNESINNTMKLFKL